jgi:integrase
MSVFRNSKTQRWVAQVSEHGRKKQIGTFGTQREAKAAVRDWEQARPSSSVTVAAWRERWLLTPTWKESTRITNREQTKAFNAEHGRRQMVDIPRSLAREWVGKHPSHHTALSAMFGAAVYDDVVEVNPFWKLVRRATRKRDLRPDWLGERDIVALEQAAYVAHGPQFGATVAGMVRFAAETGVRPGELFVLTHEDIDIDKGALYVRRAASSRARVIDTPKNGQQREIVLSDRAADAALQAARWQGIDRIFSTVSGQQFWASSFSWVWKPVKAAAGRPTMDWYELRHYCATKLLEAGMSEADVATQLGHTDGGELVRRVYGHPSDRAARVRLREAMNREEEAA